jgi:cell division protein FtsB
MDFSDPIRAKRMFVTFLILAIIFFLASGAFGYLFYTKNRAYKSLEAEKNQLQENTQISASDLEKLRKENEDLKKQVADWEEKTAQVKTYTAVLSYVTGLVSKHNGFDHWTEAEFQQGRRLAQATGNSSFVAEIDWLWHHEEISQMTRMVRFMNDIVSGVNGSLD